MEDDPLIGTLVADRYRVGRRLGEGGMGLVYLAVHETLRKPVALKVLATASRNDRETLARFEREAIAAANLKHPNIAEAADFGQLPDGGLYIVMEYVEGTTLRQVLADQGKLPPERALAILQQVGSALAMAHAREVVHRDLKPENVILTRSPESSGLATELVKVIDFGVAKLRSTTFGGGGTGLTSAGSVFGTPTYMSPEQVMGQVVDGCADQYALGVIAFELLTGKPPYHADDVGQLMMMHVGAPVPSTREQVPGLPAEVDVVTSKMLAKLPEERFASVAEAIQALTTALSAKAVPAPPSSARLEAPPMAPMPTHATTMSSAKAPVARGKAVVVVLAAVAAALVVVVVLVIVLVRSHRDDALPPELAAALADWNLGKFETSSAAIGKALTAKPELAELDAVSLPLAAPVADESARRALGQLFDTTALGGSHAMASALANVAVAGEPKGRDNALGLLRGRQRLLTAEHGARVRLRDAETCEAFDAARAEAKQAATTSTQQDLDRIDGEACKALLRVNRLCDACASRSSVAGKGPTYPIPTPPPPPGKGKGKGHGKK